MDRCIWKLYRPDLQSQICPFLTLDSEFMFWSIFLFALKSMPSAFSKLFFVSWHLFQQIEFWRIYFPQCWRVGSIVWSIGRLSLCRVLGKDMKGIFPNSLCSRHTLNVAIPHSWFPILAEIVVWDHTRPLQNSNSGYKTSSGLTNPEHFRNCYYYSCGLCWLSFLAALFQILQLYK